MAKTLGADNQYAGGITYSTPAFQLGEFNNAAPNAGFSFDLPLATVAAFNTQALDFINTRPQTGAGLLGQAMTPLLSGGTKDFTSFLQTNIDTVAGQASKNLTFMENLAQQGQIFSILRGGQGIQKTIQFGKAGGCYITTAICEKNSKPDDCDELQTLRAFRDDFMRKDARYAPLVDEYYKVAPEIVARIKVLPDKGEAMFANLERNYLVPAIEAIKAGDKELALTIYISMVAYAGDAVGVETEGTHV